MTNKKYNQRSLNGLGNHLGKTKPANESVNGLAQHLSDNNPKNGTSSSNNSSSKKDN